MPHLDGSNARRLIARWLFDDRRQILYTGFAERALVNRRRSTPGRRGFPAQ